MIYECPKLLYKYSIDCWFSLFSEINENYGADQLYDKMQRDRKIFSRAEHGGHLE